jgi:hypothetical protein
MYCIDILNGYIQFTKYIASKVSTPFQPMNNLNITLTQLQQPQSIYIHSLLSILRP